MKVFLTLAFLFFNCATLFAQNGIEREIRNLPDTPSDIITKARRLLRTEFENGNLLKVKVLKEYIMDSLHNDSVIGLSEHEQILLHYWTQDFSKILAQSIIPVKNEFQGCVIFVPYSPAEPLLHVLKEKTHKHSDTLFSFVEASLFPQEDKDFLKLHIHSVLFDTRHRGYYDSKDLPSRDELNQLADTFLKEYPDSKYENYVRSNIRVVYGRTETAVAVDFSIGVGIFNGQVDDSFETAFMAGFGLEYNYRNLGVLGRVNFGDSRTKKDIVINDKFVKKGLAFRPLYMDLGASYAVFENDVLKIAPTAGIGFASIFPLQKTVDENAELKDAETGLNFAYSFGLNTDFKLGSIMNDAFYWPLRFRYGYTALDFKGSGIRGGIHTITVGMGMFISDNERVY